MDGPKVLLLVNDGDLRVRYEGILRFCGFEPVPLAPGDGLENASKDAVAGCVLTDHRSEIEAMCAKLLAAAVPIVRIDPFIRHARQHLPFDVVLPATSEPRDLIAALRQLVPPATRPG